MNLTTLQMQTIMFNLRCIAERHSNDIIANHASDLAYRMESFKTPFNFNSLQQWEQDLVRFSFQLKNDPKNAHIFDMTNRKIKKHYN
jgi:hypothetical protein